ncbi:hypothetical protein FBY03_11195 [Pseudomonas sp. SJZ079]|uniref:hypothetical protein n=1 Tax=Pseudomonas sp. SJZ079 TaxID=2572887 RepID=UPI00119C6DB4|nr:hypothetical protein [Pseudomonas sp. SJZ079]TWC35047.1 hypothetical protein FBY03_11195 [Pseudomonas sp. SJZ079]
MQLFLNNWAATLTAPATATDGQMTIDAMLAAELVGLVGYLGGGFYAVTAALTDEHGAEIAWEVLYVFSNTDGELLVQRAQEGTSALDLPAGTQISGRLTAGSITSFLADVHALGRFAKFSESEQLTLADQVSAHIFSPASNAAALLFEFSYANINYRALNISIDLYPFNSSQTFDLTIPEGWGVLCDLPAGTAVNGTGEAPYVLTLPASELYVIEIRGLDYVRVNIRTFESYQQLA